MAGEAPLTIARAHVDSVEATSWQDLFSGFETLRAITYSSDPTFLCKVVSLFERAEVVFGCPDVIAPAFKDAVSMGVASATTALEDLRQAPAVARKLAEGIKAGHLSLLALRGRIGHSKLYLLEDETAGRRRVIVGSANLSRVAFSGRQQEEIIVFDDDESAWNYYLARWQEAETDAADEIRAELIDRAIATEGTDTLVPSLPVMEGLIERKITIAEPPTDTETVKELNKLVYPSEQVTRLGKALAAAKPKPEKADGRIIYTPKFAEKWMRQFAAAKQRQRTDPKPISIPKLVCDIETGTVTLNGKDVTADLNAKEVTADARALATVMDGVAAFSGPAEESQNEFWKFLVWWFAQTTFPALRQRAETTDHSLMLFPIHAILYGASNAGKTTFCRLLARLLTGKDAPAFPTREFTALKAQAVQAQGAGLPLYVDDLPTKGQSRWKYFEEAVKNGTWGLGQTAGTYASLAVSSNDLKALESAVSKRTVCCRVDATLDKVTGVRQAKTISRAMDTVTGALFRRWFTDTAPEWSRMWEEMGADDDQYLPDAFALTSASLATVIEDSVGPRPWAKKVRYDDYFGTKVLSRKALRHLRDAWDTNRASFEIDPKRNSVKYTFPEKMDKWSVREIRTELPEALVTSNGGDYIIMDLKVLSDLIDRPIGENPFLAALAEGASQMAAFTGDAISMMGEGILGILKPKDRDLDRPRRASHPEGQTSKH